MTKDARDFDILSTAIHDLTALKRELEAHNREVPDGLVIQLRDLTRKIQRIYGVDHA